MYKITMRASGIREGAGAEAAKNIEAEFKERRAWHHDAACVYGQGTLTLVAFNDYDENGLALSDEFSDCLSAYLGIGDISDDGVFVIVSVELLKA